MSLDPPLEHKPQPDEGPAHKEIWATGDVAIRDVEDAPGAPREYTIKETFHTLTYKDSVGQLVFYCETSTRVNAPRTVSLAETREERGDLVRYEIAAQRAAKYLRSHSYIPRIFDPTLMDWEALHAANEGYRAKLITEGQMTMKVFTPPDLEPLSQTQGAPPPGWFKRIIQWLRKP